MLFLGYNIIPTEIITFVASFSKFCKSVESFNKIIGVLKIIIQVLTAKATNVLLNDSTDLQNLEKDATNVMISVGIIL